MERAKASEPVQAESLLFQALTYDPFLVGARLELAALHTRRAESADAEAETLLASEAWEAAVAALERAQSVAPTTERAKKIVQTQTTAEYAAGLALYNEKRYEQAAFQFRKALARDPNHADAKRHMNFALKFAQDPTDDTQTDPLQFSGISRGGGRLPILLSHCHKGAKSAFADLMRMFAA